MVFVRCYSPSPKISISILELRSQHAYFGIRHFNTNEIPIAS